MQPRLALSAADKQYREMSVTPKRIELMMVVQGQKTVLHFPTPPQLLEKGCEPGVPDIWIDDQNRVMFGFCGKTDPGRPEFSERYVVGVDVGITNPAAYVVWDTEKKEIVEHSLLGQRARSLNNKIKRSAKQVSSLQKKNRSEEAALHREHLSNRRLELSILIAQELANVSWRYGNAIVSFEDLSHIKNTMKHGRWFRGEVFRRARDMVEADGGRVMKVNAAYTSQRCHVCQSDLDMSNYSNPVCESCGITHHRDLNAAANIAQRANVKKAGETISMSQFIRNRAIGSVDIQGWRAIAERALEEIEDTVKNQKMLRKKRSALTLEADNEDDNSTAAYLMAQVDDITRRLDKIVAKTQSRKNTLNGRMSMPESEQVKWRGQRLCISASDYLRMMIFGLEPDSIADSHMSLDAKRRFYISIIEVSNNGWGNPPNIYHCSQCENYMDEIRRLRSENEQLRAFS